MLSARDALKYGRVDPLAYKLVAWELRLQKLGQKLLRLQTALQRGDRSTCLAVVGGLVLYVVLYHFFPLWDMFMTAARTAFLLIITHVTIVVPIGRRFPFLYKGVARAFKTWVLGVIHRLRSHFMRQQVKASNKFEGDVHERLSDDDWNKLCQKIGTRVTVARGETLGRQDAVGNSLYRLVSGEVAIVNDAGEMGTEIALDAPVTLFQVRTLQP
jgi:hypothetical protein